MLNMYFPEGIRDDDKLNYRCLQLVSSLFSTLKDYWGFSTEKTMSMFNNHGIYKFVEENYDFYHTVGHIYIVEDLCNCLDLPKGSWK